MIRPLHPLFVFCFGLLLFGTALDSTAAPAGPANAPGAPIDFNRQVRPILSQHCFACHGPDESARKAKLRLDLKEALGKPAKSGEVPVVPGKPGESELLRRLTTTDEDDRMPPLKAGKPLSAAQIEVMRQWIAQGAKWNEHWAYVKPVAPPLPSVKQRAWPRTEIDYFILARLEAAGLAPSPEAARETLFRRASLDLTGLPPEPEELDLYLADRRPDAYARWVDHLLASPHYGERWARPWLDQARYADSNGYEADNRRTIWPYRDWVIKALNADMPFDQFTIEQLAGDLLPNATAEQKIATGFHRNTMVNTEGGTDEEEFRVAAILDRVNTTFEVWMGSTIACAQCHTHKYDPFSQIEYYQLFAFFNQTRDKGRSNEPVLDLLTPEQLRLREDLRKEIAAREKELETTDIESGLRGWEAKAVENARNVEAQWKLVSLTNLQASGAVQLEAGDDQSVRATGALPDTATYETTVASPPDQPITAFRLETLVDEQTPLKSSGRGDEGDFALSEFVAYALPASGTEDEPSRLELGPWHLLGAFRGSTVSEAYGKSFINEDKVDLTRTYQEGKLKWQERPDLIDGRAHPLQGENSAFYVYRRIVTPAELPLRVSLGSDDGLQVWLNGKKLLAREVLRTVAADQERFELQLARGTNHLLLKINNGTGDGGFYFAAQPDTRAPHRVYFDDAYADFSMERYDARKAFDGNPATGWSIAAHEATNRVDRFAVFIPTRPLGLSNDTRLVIALRQETDRSRNLLARFRLAYTAAPAESLRALARLPDGVRAIVCQPLEKRSEADGKALVKHYRSTASELEPLRKKIAELKKQEPKDYPTTLVMEAVEKPRATHLFIRGSHLSPAAAVEAGVPSIWHPLAEGTPTNRLGFARWLVHPDNPLVARVTVNRIWAQYFGTGLVETSEDFGSQGEAPSDRALLDWLATEFVRRNWSLKAMQRVIALSAAYRQSSRVTPEQYSRDAFNRLMGRGPRIRMEAEMLRDTALAIGGLLQDRIGGPSVFPFQPEGVWNSPYNKDSWQTSIGRDQFRRGVYTFWRRTSPYAAFAAFDAPSRETACERRMRSNTPLQALVTLNDPAFFAAALGLAEQLVRYEKPAFADRLDYAMRRCVSRHATPEEVRRLNRLYESALARFRRAPEEARKMLQLSVRKEVPAERMIETAAWAVVANALLNLDETLTKG